MNVTFAARRIDFKSDAVGLSSSVRDEVVKRKQSQCRAVRRAAKKSGEPQPRDGQFRLAIENPIKQTMEDATNHV